MKLEVTRWELYVTATEENDEGPWVHFSEIEPAISSFEDQLAAATARIEKLERMVVWVVENEARLFLEHQSYEKPLLFKGQHPLQNTIFVTPTAPSILAAVEKAMGEAKP